MTTYLVDTNHCSKILDGHQALIQKLIALNQADELVTCSIVRGELIFMAHHSQRVAANLRRVKSFLGSMNVYEVGNSVADVYGQVKADIYKKFAHIVRKKPKLESLGFLENDLWIAAVALQHGFTVVSADGDFTRIQQVAPLQLESWWTP